MATIECVVSYADARLAADGEPQAARAEAWVEIDGEAIAGEYVGDATPAAARKRAVDDLIAKLQARGLSGVLKIV